VIILRLQLLHFIRICGGLHLKKLMFRSSFFAEYACFVIKLMYAGMNEGFLLSANW